MRNILWLLVLASVLSGVGPALAGDDGLPQADQWYVLECRASGGCLEVNPDELTRENGAHVHQWACQLSAWQQWKFVAVDGGKFRIVNRSSGLCLDACAPDITKNGAFLQQWDWHGGPNQTWKLEAAADGYWRIINGQSGKTVDIDWWTITKNGAKAQQWDGRGDAGTNQMWKLVPVK